jgi:hypothetical protein
MPPEIAHTDPHVARRTALATAVFNELEGIEDSYPAVLAETAGWARHDFNTAVARVVRASKTELERPAQRSLFEEVRDAAA